MITRQKKIKTAFWIAGCIGLLAGGLIALFGFTCMSERHDSTETQAKSNSRPLILLNNDLTYEEYIDDEGNLVSVHLTPVLIANVVETDEENWIDEGFIIPPSQEITFVHVEEMPQFPGGDKTLLKWL